MNSLLLHLLILWGVAAAVLGVLLAVWRRRDSLGLEHPGIFGFVTASFGVVVGLTTFFASQHYTSMRQSAEQEATSLGQLAALSGAFPRREGQLLREQAYCYATAVITDDWGSSEERGSPAVAARERAIYVVLRRVGRGNPQPATWYSSSVSSALAVGSDRQDRLLQSRSQIPDALWILLYVGAAIMVLFAFLFHVTTRMQVGGMLAVVLLMLTAVFGVLAALDAPAEKPFGLSPTAMKAERALLAEDVDLRGRTPEAFCAALPAPAREPGVLR